MNEIRNWKKLEFISFYKRVYFMRTSWQSKTPLEKRNLACDPREVTEALWNSSKMLMVFVLSSSWICYETMYGKGFTNVKVAYKCRGFLLGPYVGRPAFISDLEPLKTFACFF